MSLLVGVTYNPEISLGHIVTVIGVGLTMLSLYLGWVKRYAVLESRVSDLWKEFLQRKANGQRRRITDTQEE